MRFRYPAVPLAVHSPYFSIWSMDDVPNREDTCHWTGKPNPLRGTVKIGNREYGFLGRTNCPPMKTVWTRVDACTTEYQLECPEARVYVRFTSPLLLDDLKVLARPLTYVAVEVAPKEELTFVEQYPKITVSLSASEVVCLDHPGESPVNLRFVSGKQYEAGILENTVQKPLNRSGDDVRIDWGSFCLAVGNGGEISCANGDEGLWVCARKEIHPGREALFTLSYDEGKCVQYFHKDLSPLWKEEFSSLPELLESAFEEYGALYRRCDTFSSALACEAQEAGGDQYAQILSAAYRQVIAAHCICRDEEGELLFISKECFSNGCAATTDVNYPAMPLFLRYCPKLVFAMERPVLRYAATPEWPFNFAPHDAGTYPLLNGQAYSNGTDPEYQMPVEECGNMLLMTCAATLASGDDSFARRHWALLTRWAEYLRERGMDPDNQLCTDDFAGHLAHNCNLSIKAILGVAAYGVLKKRRGEEESGEEWINMARKMGSQWVEAAANKDGTYRLAFDRPDTFSMKYNAVWDTLLGTDVFPKGTWDKELESYLGRRNPYGMPLDNRAGYTKSDWMVWVASMMKRREDFEAMVGDLWNAYDNMPQRVPLGDWFETEDAWQVSFQNRSVQGGLFLKLLMERGVLGG